MAVQVLQDWTLFGSGSASPSGTVTLDSAADNRCIIYWQSWEWVNTSASCGIQIGSVEPTGLLYEVASEGGDNPGIQINYWDEAACAAISAAGSSNISFTDRPNFTKRIWALGVFSSVDQVTFPVTSQGVSVSCSANAPLNLATPGEAGDHVIFAHAATRTSSSCTFLPLLSASAGFTRRFQAASLFTGALADGPWASTSAQAFARAAQPNTVGITVVLQESGGGVDGEGSADGYVPTVAGVGERVITAAGSLDGYIPTFTGGGVVAGLINGAGTLGGYIPTLSGAGVADTTVTGFFPSISRVVRLDDETLGFACTLQDRKVGRLSLLSGNVGKGCFLNDNYHSQGYFTDDVAGRYAAMGDTVAKSVTVQGIE